MTSMSQTMPPLNTMSWSAQVGRTWFKWRSFSPVPFFLLMLVLPADFRADGWTVALAVFGVVLAESLRIWAVGHAGSATRTRGDTVPELVHAGPYRYVRNPLYIANIVLYTMVGVIGGFYYLSLAIFIVSVLEYIFIVQFEEHVLKQTFGPNYREFLARVPRWLPAFTPRIASTPHTFSLSRGLRSEKSTLILIGVMVALFGIKFWLQG